MCAFKGFGKRLQTYTHNITSEVPKIPMTIFSISCNWAHKDCCFKCMFQHNPLIISTFGISPLTLCILPNRISYKGRPVGLRLLVQTGCSPYSGAASLCSRVILNKASSWPTRLPPSFPFSFYSYSVPWRSRTNINTHLFLSRFHRCSPLCSLCYFQTQNTQQAQLPSCLPTQAADRHWTSPY